MTLKIVLSDFQINLQKEVSPRGIKFVHLKKLNAPISISVCSRGGARSDPIGKEGLAHFFEHMLFVGTKKYPTKKALSLPIEEIGATYSGSTGLETISVDFVIARSEHIPLIRDFLDQIFNHSLFEVSQIDIEREIIKTEVLAKLDTNNRILTTNIRNLLFGNNQISHNITGSEDSLQRITRDDLIYFFKEIFPQDVTVVSAGGCDIQNIVDSLESILPHKDFKNIEEPPKLLKGSKVGITTMKDHKLVYGRMALPTCPLGAGDEISLRILSTYLGGGRTSLFTELLRYDEGLLYSIGASNSHFSDFGYFSIDFSSKKEVVQKIIDRISKILDKLIKNGIPIDDLEHIKNKIINSSVISKQTVQSWTKFQMQRELLRQDNDYTFADFLNSIRSVRKENVDLVAKKYLTVENSYLWLVGNIEEIEFASDF
ncbi:insulinase family protein [candidate division WWE3 bacterium]|nr:insulinase family protein [candidate division WWE3 bacterium]